MNKIQKKIAKLNKKLEKQYLEFDRLDKEAKKEELDLLSMEEFTPVEEPVNLGEILDLKGIERKRVTIESTGDITITVEDME